MRIVIMILLASSSLFAQKSEFIRIWGTIGDDFVSSPVRIGVREDATTGLDTDYETEIFPGTPAGEFGIICRVNYFDETQNAQVYAYNDFIPYIDETFYYEHNLEVILDYGREHTIKWDDMRGLADSAYLSIGNDFIKIDMLEDTEYKVDNENVSHWRYTVKVYYNPSLTNTNVQSNIGDIISLYPNPINDVLVLENTSNIKSYKIIDMQGNILRNELPITNRINMDSYPNGSYLIVFTSIDGEQTIRQIIISR